MLASTLRSNIAVQVSIFITRAFIALRQAYISTQKHDIRLEKIEHKLDNLSNYIEDILQTQNDINDDTATQLELINQTLAELQAEKTLHKEFTERKPVGFKIEK